MSRPPAEFFRRDLNLPSRWWHRLAKVLFMFSTVFAVLISGLLFYELEAASAKHYKILKNLKDYFEEAVEREQDSRVAGEASNVPKGTVVVPTISYWDAFEGFAQGSDIGGSLGCARGDRNVEWLSRGLVQERPDCKVAVLRPSTMKADQLPDALPADFHKWDAPAPRRRVPVPPDATIKELMEVSSRTMSVCEVPQSLCGGNISQIVRYEETTRYGLRNFANIAARTLAVALVWMSLGLLFYYKVFIYVVFGRAQR
jgi:hypothetical protein